MKETKKFLMRLDNRLFIASMINMLGIMYAVKNDNILLMLFSLVCVWWLGQLINEVRDLINK